MAARIINNRLRPVFEINNKLRPLFTLFLRHQLPSCNAVHCSHFSSSSSSPKSPPHQERHNLSVSPQSTHSATRQATTNLTRKQQQSSTAPSAVVAERKRKEKDEPHSRGGEWWTNNAPFSKEKAEKALQQIRRLRASEIRPLSEITQDNFEKFLAGEADKVPSGIIAELRARAMFPEIRSLSPSLKPVTPTDAFQLVDAAIEERETSSGDDEKERIELAAVQKTFKRLPGPLSEAGGVLMACARGEAAAIPSSVEKLPTMKRTEVATAIAYLHLERGNWKAFRDFFSASGISVFPCHGCEPFIEKDGQWSVSTAADVGTSARLHFNLFKNRAHYEPHMLLAWYAKEMTKLDGAVPSHLVEEMLHPLVRATGGCLRRLSEKEVAEAGLPLRAASPFMQRLPELAGAFEKYAKEQQEKELSRFIESIQWLKSDISARKPLPPAEKMVVVDSLNIHQECKEAGGILSVIRSCGFARIFYIFRKDVQRQEKIINAIKNRGRKDVTVFSSPWKCPDDLMVLLAALQAGAKILSNDCFDRDRGQFREFCSKNKHRDLADVFDDFLQKSCLRWVNVNGELKIEEHVPYTRKPWIPSKEQKRLIFFASSKPYIKFSNHFRIFEPYELSW